MSNQLAIWLEEKVKSFLEETVDTIVGHHQDALQTNEDYRGRQLLELLQNADDAYSSKEEKHKAYIELTDKELIIKNTGIGFSKEGVESLLTSNLSPKDNNYIGNKGLGFRSILNWAKKIHIYSHSKENDGIWSFSFSRDYAKERFNSLPIEKQELARKKAQNNESHPIATLRCPKWEDTDRADKSYTTAITINIKEFAIHEIKEQISKINENILVFLPYLTEIEIVDNTQTTIYKKLKSHHKDNIEEVIVEKYSNENTSLKQWNVHHKKGTINVQVENESGENYTEQKDYHLAIAYQDDFSDDANHLFSFFSTEVPFHIPALVHGTFDLEGNRNKISKTDSNIELLKKLADLLIETSQYVASTKEIASWEPLSLIYFESDKYDDRLRELNFYKYLFEQISSSTLFPCHDGQYRMAKDTLLLNYGNHFTIHKDINNTLKFDKFNVLANLLLYTEDKRHNELISLWRNSFINSDNISSYLNQISSKLNEDERVETIYFVSKYDGLYCEEYLELLVDDNNDVIKSDIAVYTPKTKNTLEFEIPKHINLRFMSRSLYEKLVKKFSHQFRDKTEADSRKLQAILKSFLNIHSYEPDPVIRKIISNTNKSNIEEIKAMIQSLYIAFKSAREALTELDVKVPLISKENSIVFADELYFGTPYTNGEFIETIYDRVDINYLASPTELGIYDKTKLEEYFQWLGVNQYIKVEAINIKNDDSHEFFKWFKQNTTYDFKYKTDFTVYASSIKHLKEVFKNNSLEDVLLWLKLSNGLNIIETRQISFLTGRSISQKTLSTPVDKESYSFLQWQIENSIPTKSGKYSSPKNCVLPDLNLDLAPVLETVEVDYKKLDEYGVERGEAKDLLHKIGIYRDFDEVDSNKIASILNELHISDEEGKQAKKIYRLVLKKYADYKKDELWKIKLKCEDIQVFCKKGDDKSYFSTNEAFYLDELIYPKAILKNYPLIEIGIRQGQSKIKHIFGVEPLKDLEISLDHKSSKENYLCIQDDIDSVKPYILALRLKQLEGKDQSRVSSSLKEMKVKLMSKLAVNLEGNTVVLDEFDYILNDNTFYISTQYMSIDELRKNIKFIDLVSVLFSTILKVTSDEGKYKEIYKDKYNRKHILDTHTENEADRYLEEAKKLLHIRSHKLEFWNDIAVLMEIDEVVTENTDINEFFNFVFDVSSINYENLSADSNYKILKDVFDEKITLEQFNKKSTLTIDFIPYFERQLFSKFERLKKQYKSYIWKQLNDTAEAEQKSLRQKWRDYEKIEFEEIINDFKFNVDSYFKQCLYKQTNVTLEELESFEYIDFEKFFFMFREKKDEDLLALLWNTNDESLSYFESNFEKLNKQYDLLVESLNATNEEEAYLKEGLSPEYREVEISLPANSKDNTKTFATRKQSTNHRGKQSSSENIITGQKGEELVFEHLKKFFPRVDWVSEYAKKSGVNSDGRDGYGYDITYWDDEDIQYFVEVKSTKTNSNGNSISFQMSSNEYKVALEKGKYYKIFYVSSVGGYEPKIKSFTFNDQNVQKDIESYLMTTNIGAD